MHALPLPSSTTFSGGRARIAELPGQETKNARWLLDPASRNAHVVADRVVAHAWAASAIALGRCTYLPGIESTVCYQDPSRALTSSNPGHPVRVSMRIHPHLLTEESTMDRVFGPALRFQLG